MNKPPLLKQGDKVAIVAPAGKVKKGALDDSLRLIESWGLKIIISEHAYDQHGYFSSNDANRLSDLQLALDNPEITAIIMARGGYGTTRILEKLDFRAFLRFPKWVVGFSDITALHLKIQELEYCSIHGAMGTTMAQDKVAAARLRELLFTGLEKGISGSGARVGSAEAEIIGGNLALLVDSMGTANELNVQDKILFIEDIGEPAYKIDRMMHQLLRSGKLEQLAGLVIGQFSNVKEEKEFGAGWPEIIESVVSSFEYPVAHNFPIGHEPNNYPIMVGGKYRLEVLSDRARLQLIS
jgi:muramoyltetrapeptide carboxypeptidase